MCSSRYQPALLWWANLERNWNWGSVACHGPPSTTPYTRRSKFCYKLLIDNISALFLIKIDRFYLEFFKSSIKWIILFDSLYYTTQNCVVTHSWYILGHSRRKFPIIVSCLHLDKFMADISTSFASILILHCEQCDRFGRYINPQNEMLAGPSKT